MLFLKEFLNHTSVCPPLLYFPHYKYECFAQLNFKLLFLLFFIFYTINMGHCKEQNYNILLSHKEYINLLCKWQFLIYWFISSIISA